MPIPSHALQTAAGALHRISETNPGERGRRASVVALVLQAIERVGEDVESSEFMLRRAEAEIDRVESRVERSYLRRILVKVLEDETAGVSSLLAEYAAALEGARRLAEAEAVLSLARSLEPDRADIALRAARVARLQGDRVRALELYGVARELDGGDGSIARLAAIGEAVADESEAALSRSIRDAIVAGDQEAAGVGLEERARLRRERGNRAGAARDFAVAGARFTDSVDRARVGHLLADLHVASGDPMAAREALLLTLGTGDRSQRDHARARLHTVARDLGDQLGMRRWRSFERPALVSLSARPTGVAAESEAPKLLRWRHRMESLLEPAIPS